MQRMPMHIFNFRPSLLVFWFSRTVFVELALCRVPIFSDVIDYQTIVLSPRIQPRNHPRNLDLQSNQKNLYCLSLMITISDSFLMGDISNPDLSNAPQSLIQADVRSVLLTDPALVQATNLCPAFEIPHLESTSSAPTINWRRTIVLLLVPQLPQGMLPMITLRIAFPPGGSSGTMSTYLAHELGSSQSTENGTLLFHDSDFYSLTSKFFFFNF